MNSEEARTRLIALYEGIGCEHVADDGADIRFKLGTYGSIVVDEDEIARFEAVADTLGSFRAEPYETSVIGPQHREQRIDFAENSRGPFNIGRDGGVFRFGPNGDGMPFVEVGPATSIYRYTCLQNAQNVPYLKERFGRRGMAPYNNDPFRGFLTIRVLDFTSDWTSQAISETDNLFESCLFELSYMKGLPFELIRNWPPTLRERMRGRASRQPRAQGTTFPLKPVRYDPTVTRFYHRALSSDDAYISFISYYHVLEFFFVSITDALLYSRLARIVNDPAFAANPTQLDRLITSVEDHSRTSDETEMLKSVLREYVDEGDLMTFIANQEAETSVQFYTNKTSCFGYELEKIVLKEGHVTSAVAKRIKTIRNALVHSSDRYERKDRYVPGEMASSLLRRELPLLKFIAERVIIASASTT